MNDKTIQLGLTEPEWELLDVLLFEQKQADPESASLRSKLLAIVHKQRPEWIWKREDPRDIDRELDTWHPGHPSHYGDR